MQPPSQTKFPLARYRFTFKALEPVTFASQQGSLLRGALGHALRSIACMTDADQCDGCPLIANCPYPQLFEPRRQNQQGKVVTPPPPYVLHFEEALEGRVALGQSFTFSMNLFGPALDHLSTLVFAWRQAGKNGLGKGKKKAQLTRVDYLDEQNTWQPVLTLEQPSILPHQAKLSLPSSQPVNKVIMELQTPTRITLQSRLCGSDDLTAELLLRGLHRRVTLFSAVYLGWQPSMPELPEDMSLTFTGSVHKWQRYSTRHQRTMSLDGLVGPIKLQGTLDGWFQHLWLGQFTHLGKNTSFGLGQYKLQLLK